MATLHQLRCFLATVEHGSFTRAAESLGLAQPSLSEQIRGSLHAAIEVENVETALEVAAVGVADTVTARGALRRQHGRVAAPLYSTSLEPRLHDHFAIVHRPDVTLSRPIQAVIEMATRRMREVCAQ